MSVQSLTVAGFRGLSTKQRLDIAVPNGSAGSGITVLVGSNNAGKSSVIEALRTLAADTSTVSFSEGKRNKTFGDHILFELKFSDGSTRRVRSIRAGGSQAIREGGADQGLDMVVVPSRRTFQAFFSDPGYVSTRQQYATQAVPVLREPSLASFTNRLFELEKDEARREKFDQLLARVLGYTPDWAIDQSDGGQSYLKFLWQNEVGLPNSHSSDGLGDGLISLFVIVDSLHDSEPGSFIVIDEPELSLHPQFQRRLRELLSEFAADRQILYATHSPYLVDWSDVAHGASITRVHKTPGGTTLSTASHDSLVEFTRLGARNRNNPHVLGTQALEVFFLEGGVLLAEGQEDVVMLPIALDQLGVELPATFFGWGVGGAENMGKVCQLLSELGFQTVAAILDNDKINLVESLAKDYPTYKFACIPADDVRPKKARAATAAKTGLLDESGVLRPELRIEFETTALRIREYLLASPRGGEIL